MNGNALVLKDFIKEEMGKYTVTFLNCGEQVLEMVDSLSDFPVLMTIYYNLEFKRCGREKGYYNELLFSTRESEYTLGILYYGRERIDSQVIAVNLYSSGSPNKEAWICLR